MSLKEQIEAAINRCGVESGSNTPDWILAEYLIDCLAAFDKATKSRSDYFSINSAEAIHSGALLDQIETNVNQWTGSDRHPEQTETTDKTND